MSQSNDLRLNIFLSRNQISNIVSKLAVDIQHDYIEKSILLICILKGSLIFTADLVRQLDLNLEIDFVQLASYHSGTMSCGKVNLIHDTIKPIKDRQVLVIEDIVDTGLSTSFILDHLQKKSPASLKLCSLLSKPSRNIVSVKIDYLGIDVPDKFLVGYGLDFNERFRELPDIYSLEK
jgi:hypoxanthine phosphoribosyltransferase